MKTKGALSRRDFALSAAGLLSLPLLARVASAQSQNLVYTGDEAEPHFFLFIQIFGAWDVCLAFDPKDRELVLPNGERQFDQPYAMDEVREFHGIKLAPHGLALAKYADRMAIINGIDMEVDNGHTPDIVMTGLQGARQLNAPYVQAVLAKKQPFLRRRSVPHLYMSYDGQFMAGPYAGNSISATAKDFLTFIGPGDGNSGDFEVIQAMLGDYNHSLPQSRRQVFGGYMGAVQSAANVNTMLKKYGFKVPADVNDPQGTGNLIGQLFSSGILGSATLSFGSKFSFDTHSSHYAQHPLKAALEQVDVICGELKNLKLDENHSVFDRTTVVMTAEYARTPRLNESKGKDHNFRTNSFAILGHKVRPGVYGMSGIREENGQHETHAGLPINFETGQVDGSDKKILHARNIWAGFGGIAGVDLSAEFGSDAAPIKFLG